MDYKTYLTNKNFCPVPWTGFMYNFDGTVKHCIRSPVVNGNLHDQTINDIISSDQVRQHKDDMLADNPCESCNVCYTLEGQKKSFDIISDRIFYLKELKTVDRKLYADPTAHSLATIDIRWSNVCNFACIYCSPAFSSKWSTEMNVHHRIPEQDRIDELKMLVMNNVENLKHVYLAGGEPLLIKENYELLKELQLRNPNVNIRINTNLSKVDTRIFDLLCEFRHVHWTVSVESIEAEYEYIRYGGSWADFVTNLAVIQNLGHKVSFNMLHFLLNYLSIFECIDYLRGNGFHDNSFIIGPVVDPEYLNIRHLPNHMLNSLKTVLDNRISNDSGFLLGDGLRNMREILGACCRGDIELSLQKIQELDCRRGVNSRQVFSKFYKSLGE